MHNVSADLVHLRELAGRCLRVAASLTDENEIASLRQMATEYEAMANRIEPRLLLNPQPPVGS